jgi:hypothetical protein
VDPELFIPDPDPTSKKFRIRIQVISLCCMWSSVVDPEQFIPDPDPTSKKFRIRIQVISLCCMWSSVVDPELFIPDPELFIPEPELFIPDPELFIPDPVPTSKKFRNRIRIQIWNRTVYGKKKYLKYKFCSKSSFFMF